MGLLFLEGCFSPTLILLVLLELNTHVSLVSTVEGGGGYGYTDQDVD